MRAPVAMSLIACCTSFGQTFDVASVKVSQQQVGKDAEGPVTFGPARLSGKNVTLKSLIAAAYQAQPHQVIGGPNWLDSSEYDIDAKAARPANKDQLRLMLRALLADRFQLSLHRETRELQAYELVTAKRGPRVNAAKDGVSMTELANLISIQLTIPAAGDDPAKPSIARGPPPPVLDKTGLPGTYDIRVDLKPEPGTDMFTLWQRFLQDRLGLKLESKKKRVEFLVVDGVERTPTSN
jgi:uncharacterized protein (TIGR03435 family)